MTSVGDLSSTNELMDAAFDIGLDHNEPAPAVFNNQDETYDKIMGLNGGAKALSDRLVSFREWLSQDAGVTVHPNVCVVNGEATDGTKHAPVLCYGPPPGVAAQQANHQSSNARGNHGTQQQSRSEGKCGMVDGDADQALYDRTMGCQVRAAREIKKDETLMTVPRSAMITPDLIASSDAGQVILACCEPSEKQTSFWDAFENTTICEKKMHGKVQISNGTQLLVKILQERKKASAAESKAMKALDEKILGVGGIAGTGKNVVELDFTLAPRRAISTRAPFLAFLIQQRFANTKKPLVVSESTEANEELDDGTRHAQSTAKRIRNPPGSPETYGPYARTLPSSVCLPICWKREDLSLLSGCPSGSSMMQDITASTLQLVQEYVALVNAGLLHRFPTIFPRGLITWERWVWAASVFNSRVLPAQAYLNHGEAKASDHVPESEDMFQSDPEIWDELGVMIPLLDMLNHEIEANQVTWEPTVTDKIAAEAGARVNGSDTKPLVAHPPCAISHKRVKKGNQLYTNYGLKSNQDLITMYGFGLVLNKSDEVKIGWGLTDGVGKTKAPDDYELRFFNQDGEEKEKTSNENSDSEEAKKDSSVKDDVNIKEYFVFESNDQAALSFWWSPSRVSLLERQALVPEEVISQLRNGKKMIVHAASDGSYNPHLLSAAVVATTKPSRVKHESSSKGGAFAISKSHQKVLREYLAFFLSRKMEKLLQSLNVGLKSRYDVELWTKLKEGGLDYKGNDESKVQGWQSFFDMYAYSATVEVEKRYYPLGPDSCVLTLYDGNLRALEHSIDGLSTWEKYNSGVLQQLRDLGFKVLDDDDVPGEKEEEFNDSTPNIKAERNEENERAGADAEANGKSSKEKPKESKSRSSRRRNRKRGSSGGSGSGDRPPAIKLHIGNLAYCTLASDLFEYFAAMYGRDNVLECHIPTERESGRSRGFGFVTMPEQVSLDALQPGKRHEVHGRLLKVAESNSSGSANRHRGPSMNTITAGDRCARCGYRPRYCVCSVPDIPPFNGVARGAPYHDMRPPEMDPYHREGPDVDYYGGGHRGRERNREFTPSPIRYGDRGYRDYDREYRHRRSRSPSFNRGHERDRDRRRDWSRDRYRERDASRDRSRSRERSRERRSGRGRYESRSRSARYSRSHSRSISTDRSSVDSRRRSRRSEREDSPDMDRSSRSRSKAEVDSASPPKRERKRDSARKRSRSRSRGRSRRKRNKKESKRGGRSRSRSRSHSRSERSPAA